MSETSTAWNPAAPPDSPHDPSAKNEPQNEEERDETAIGDTVFSKSWALSVLVRAVETVSGESLGREGSLKSGQKEGDDEEGEGEEEIGKEEGNEKGEEDSLDEGLEENLCHLWDASMNTDVSLYLHQQNAVELLLGVATRSKSLRLTEICIGLIGNMACQEQVCKEAFASRKTRSAVLSFLGGSDARILYETTRLVLTCVSASDKDTSQQWLEEVRDNGDVREALKFIMKSSTSDELLSSTGSLLDVLLDTSDAIVREWSTVDLVECLCHALEQTSSTASTLDSAEVYVQCFHTITTHENGVASIVECCERVTAVTLSLLATLQSSSENYLQRRHTSLHAALSLLLSLKTNSSSSFPTLPSGREVLQRIVEDVKTESETQNDGEDSLQSIIELLASLIKQ